jgi:hypothetical protein
VHSPPHGIAVTFAELTSGPIVRESVVPRPTAAGPVRPNPAARRSVTTDPVFGKPAVAEPVVAAPVVSESVVAEPVVSEPVFSEPVVAEPITPLSVAEQTGGTPSAPLTRAALRAAQGPLTSRSAVRQAEKARPAAGKTRRAAAKGRPGSDPARPAAADKARVKRSLSLPQVGIASALGLATIAAPLTGALATPAAKALAQPLPPVAAFGPAAMFPRVAAPAANAVEDAKLMPGTSESSAVPRTLAAPRTILVTRASRGTRERAVLPGCDGEVPVGAQWTNGEIPLGELCTLWEPEHSLRADAAVALAKLNFAYNKQFGANICLTDSYRNLADQRRLKAIKPGLAATPGTSQHGWALAVDLCGTVDDFGSTAYRWMRANAPTYGWDNPAWALPGGSGPTEPWHWEYLAGEDVGPGSD